jgi:hypothetical protein
MSDQPFGEPPYTNPYAPPASQAGSGSSGNPLLFPAIILLILSSFFLLCIVLSLPVQIAQIRATDPSTSEGAGRLVGQIAALTLWSVMNSAVALGAISMIRLKSYRIARTAAIFSVIPVCTPWFVLGIPFGIWALFVLSRPVVKQRFMRQ